MSKTRRVMIVLGLTAVLLPPAALAALPSLPATPETD